jgi:methylated-DNA-[protein]-cysteine S-methyltransferase
MTPFQKKILTVVAGIPRGRVATYGWVARAVGRPRAARAVGNALNKNPHLRRTPCHRVVRSDGFVGGYACGVGEKARLLRDEGVCVSRGTVDLAQYRV